MKSCALWNQKRELHKAVKVSSKGNYSLCKDCSIYCSDRIFMRHHIVKPQTGIDVSLAPDIWIWRWIGDDNHYDEDYV